MKEGQPQDEVQLYISADSTHHADANARPPHQHGAFHQWIKDVTQHTPHPDSEIPHWHAHAELTSGKKNEMDSPNNLVHPGHSAVSKVQPPGSVGTVPESSSSSKENDVFKADGILADTEFSQQPGDRVDEY
jgi:hypothetical protein